MNKIKTFLDRTFLGFVPVTQDFIICGDYSETLYHVVANIDDNTVLVNNGMSEFSRMSAHIQVIPL